MTPHPGPALPPLVQTLALHREPLGVLRRARARHGPLFSLQLIVAGPVAIAASPEAVPVLLDADPARAGAGEARRSMLPMASPRSSFGGDGALHRAARGRIAAAFEPEAIARRREAIAATARAHAERWPRGRPFRLLERVRTMIDEAFARHVLGAGEERAAALMVAVRRMLLSPGNPPLPLPGEGNDTLPGPAAALFAWRKAPVERLLGQAIDARRADPEGDDVIAVALRSSPGLPTRDLVDELLPVVMAAQEPPSVAVTWLLDRAGRSPGARDALLEGGEARERVVLETLRLQPPALAALRHATAPVEVPGGVIGPGETAILPIPLLHRDPQTFPDPDAFVPERWDAIPVDGTAAYLPFGGGARMCIGLHLSRAYFDALVPAVLGRLRLRPVAREPERMVVRATTLVPQRGGLTIAKGA